MSRERDAAAGIVSAGGGHGLSGIADAGVFLARLTRLDPAALVRLRSASDGRADGVSGRAGGADGEAGPAVRTALWARLPWGVLVSRTVAGPGPGDVTVSAAALLKLLAEGKAGLPTRRDHDWRWPLPPAVSQLVETIPGTDLRRIADAAAGALRDVADRGIGGRAVGQRALRDALLDHVAVVVTDAPATATGGSVARVEVSQRLVQAVVRMGFLGSVEPEAEPVRSGPSEPVRSGPSGLGGDMSEAFSAPHKTEISGHVRLAGRWIGLSAPFGSAWLQSGNILAIRPG
jgi:hypothetical protein